MNTTLSKIEVSGIHISILAAATDAWNLGAGISAAKHRFPLGNSKLSIIMIITTVILNIINVESLLWIGSD
jgi:hypothetical protein